MTEINKDEFVKGLVIKPDDISEHTRMSNEGKEYTYCLVPIGDSNHKLRIMESKAQILEKYTRENKEGNTFTVYPLRKDGEYVITPTHEAIGEDGKKVPWPKVTGQQVRNYADFIKIPLDKCKVSTVQGERGEFISVVRSPLSFSVQTSALKTTGFDGQPLPADKQYLSVRRGDTPNTISKFNKDSQKWAKETINFETPEASHTFGGIKKSLEVINKSLENKLNTKAMAEKADAGKAPATEAPVKTTSEPSKD